MPGPHTGRKKEDSSETSSQVIERGFHDIIIMHIISFIGRGKKMSRRHLLPALVLVPALIISGCSRTPDRMLQIKGSDTMVNLTQILAEAYMEEYPGSGIAVLGGGSGTGITGLINGTCDIANHSREIKPAEYRMLEEKGIESRTFVMAVDGLSVILPSSNPIRELSVDQIGAVFRGDIKNWIELGGPDMPISLYGRQSNSGTYVFFQEHILGNQDFSQRMKEMNGNAQIVEGVAADKAAIGYVGIGYIVDAETGLIRPDLVALRISKSSGAPAFSPLDEAAVNNGDYPIARPLYQTTGGLPAGSAAAFLNFINSPEGQTIVKKEGFFPTSQEVREKNRERLR